MASWRGAGVALLLVAILPASFGEEAESAMAEIAAIVAAGWLEAIWLASQYRKREISAALISLRFNINSIKGSFLRRACCCAAASNITLHLHACPAAAASRCLQGSICFARQRALRRAS